MMDQASELAWTLQDYKDLGQEAPERILANPDQCEGRMMTDQEVEEYLRDGMSAIKVMRDQGAGPFEKVRDAFFADLRFLVEIGRLDPQEYVEIIKPENYEF